MEVRVPQEDKGEERQSAIWDSDCGPLQGGRKAVHSQWCQQK